jgi:glycerophosphoryl diester phosphodiesterase
MRFERPIAHRGQHDKAAGIIENTRSAFARAVANGYDIECDVQITSDGVPVVIHDGETTRLLGRKGYVRDMTAAEITRTPLLGSAAGDCPEPLQALFDLVAGKVLLQVELKQQVGDDTERLAEAVARIAAGYAGPLVFESFDPRLLAAMRRHGFKGMLGIISDLYAADDKERDLNAAQRFSMRHLLHWPVSRFDFLSINYKALDLPAVRAFRALGKPVTSWTIRSAADARAALSGADQIVFEGFDPDTELRQDRPLKAS